MLLISFVSPSNLERAMSKWSIGLTWHFNVISFYVILILSRRASIKSDNCLDHMDEKKQLSNKCIHMGPNPIIKEAFSRGLQLVSRGPPCGANFGPSKYSVGKKH